MTYSYSIGDEPSSSNYRASYCDLCDADTPAQCKCISKCKECGEDHSFHPDFSRVETSIDVLNELQPTKSWSIRGLNNQKETLGND
jgi:hypothetical protein